MNVSPQGVAFIGAFEGFRANWYDDGTGVKTIGYGHTGPLPPGYKAPLTQAEGARLLLHDLAPFAAHVNSIPPVPGGLTQAQFDALCSACYNLGDEPLTAGHSLFVAVESKPRLPWPLNVIPLRNWRARVRYALDLYVNAGGHELAGLVRRRNAEGFEGFAPDGKPHYTVAQGNPYANA